MEYNITVTIYVRREQVVFIGHILKKMGEAIANRVEYELGNSVFFSHMSSPILIALNVPIDLYEYLVLENAMVETRYKKEKANQYRMENGHK